LLPLLATLPQPLALLEVGAAAGLCLIPDYYAYEFNGHGVAPSRLAPADPPTFTCRVNDATPLPAQNIEVVWRAGLDLEPIDVRDERQIAWLEALVWPGEGNRAELLGRAVDVAKADPPSVLRGDLRHNLPALAGQAPATATLVIFHTAVLAYLPDPAERADFADTVRSPFLLTRNVRPIAWTDPHGTSIHWIGT
jgi:hypothetical protein